MELGKNLKELRKKRKVSQMELGKQIGVSDVMISLYEQGKKNPSRDTLEKLADYFGVATDYLLGRESNLDELEADFPEGIQVLRRASKELTPKARAKMIRLMKAFLQEEED